ncbi:MAG: hypothetical protein ABI114_13445 [Rhodanobacter sp.]
MTNDSQVTVDGRFNTKCRPWIDDVTQRICYVSFYKLISNPERYNGKLVRVTGHLIKMFGQNVIFASRDSYNSGVDVEGIRLLGEDKLPTNIEDKVVVGLFPVTVIGVFDAKYGGDGESPLQLLGALRGNLVVKYAPRVGGGNNEQQQ